MSGHSRWAGIKHKKAIIDSKRGRVFTRIGREIAIAAREGGGNPENNARLRKAVDDAREANMPQENVKRAIQKGTGEIPGAMIEEIRYEGYAAGGVALLVEVTTDNKNRTGSEIRGIFSEHGGNMAEVGSVSWMFSLKGYLTVEKNKVREESLLELVLDAGAEDMKSSDEDLYEIITEPADFEKVKKSLESHSIPILHHEITQISKNLTPVTGATAEKVLSLIQALEEQEDVKTVYSNFDIPKEILLKQGS
ncbi:MAG: YebC/PmpR family DNA-binding transcriptional regulator [Elusimicrobia bacterium]|nr:YebC/PmpR family DNA-binding transcriptional regulator [Elusimicrobiota bacterium]MBI4217769.1 YebC/PmpR family DNA-binding transcriptional regulator [Elusimicrobiota bacterium]